MFNDIVGQPGGFNSYSNTYSSTGGGLGRAWEIEKQRMMLESQLNPKQGGTNLKDVTKMMKELGISGGGKDEDGGTGFNPLTNEAVKGAYDQFGAWNTAPGPMAADNRFEQGLASSEQRLSALLNDPSSIQESAAYKFRLGQGQEALQRQQAAKGMLGSGNRLMELTKYGQDMASQEYDNQFGRLSGLLGTYGQNWNQDMDSMRRAHTAKGSVLAEMYGTTADAATKGYTADRMANTDLAQTLLNAALNYGA